MSTGIQNSNSMQDPVRTAADPILNQDKVAVQPLAALTAQMEQHFTKDYSYYLCTMPTASIHREDGKRLPFVNGILKTNVKEDINFLNREIHVHGNPYFKEADAEQAHEIEVRLNPKVALAKQVRAEVTAEVRQNIEQDVRNTETAAIRQRTLAELAESGALDTVKLNSIEAAKLDAAKLQGVDTAGNKRLPTPQEVAASGQQVRLTPVNSTDVANASAGGESAAARAAAALAAMNAKK